MKQVLLIAAHPDDETYGAGGTIRRHVLQGDAVAVLILTDGVTARHNVVDPQKRAAEEACRQLGVNDLCFGDLPDQRLDSLPLLDVIRPIHEMIQRFKPEILYTHHRGDANQDHRAIFDATLVAVRPFEGNVVRQVLSYEVASSTEWGPPFSAWAFTPNIYVDITDTLEDKLTAVEAYRDTFQSEVKPYPHPRSPEAVRIYAQQRGITVGMKAAEAFMLIRQLID